MPSQLNDCTSRDYYKTIQAYAGRMLEAAGLTHSVSRPEHLRLRGRPVPRCYDGGMYSQKLKVDVVIRGERCACPLEWLDQFCMRNFTNSADFDDTLPVADGKLEASFRVTPERFAEGFGVWLTQRGKGEGQPVQVEVTRL